MVARIFLSFSPYATSPLSRSSISCPLYFFIFPWIQLEFVLLFTMTNIVSPEISFQITLSESFDSNKYKWTIILLLTFLNIVTHNLIDSTTFVHKMSVIAGKASPVKKLSNERNPKIYAEPFIRELAGEQYATNLNFKLDE